MSGEHGPVIWDVRPRATLRDILQWCVAVRAANRLLVTSRLDLDSKRIRLFAPAVDHVTRRLFGSSLKRTLLASSWPGTRLIGHAGRVYVARLDNDVLRRMAEVEDAIAGWTQWHDPPLPEDPCAYRQGDPYPCFISVTHEGDAWIIHDGPVPRHLATRSRMVLPPELLPPAPDFVVTESRRRTGPRGRSR
jgi:hypothetical protein